MKRLFCVLSVILGTVLSCQKIDEKIEQVPQQKQEHTSPDPEVTGMHTINVTAGFGGADTKTQIVSDGEGGYSFNWVAGDVVKVWEVVKNQDFASDDATVSTTSSTIEFPVEFPERQASQYKYFGVYPGSYLYTGAFTDLNGEQKFRINLPPRQVLSNTCFDPSADLLISKTVTTDKQPTNLNLQFGRVGAILQLVLRGLDAAKYVYDVKFQADAAIAGYTLFDPATETYSMDNYNMTEFDDYGNPIPCNYIDLVVRIHDRGQEGITSIQIFPDFDNKI